MDTARQVVRWSIPGWIFLLILAVMQILTWLIRGSSITRIIQNTAPLLTPVAVATVLTAGVPLGFILYQIYYSWYGKALPFDFVNLDRGATILLALSDGTRDTLCKLGTPDLANMDEQVNLFLLPYPLRRLKAEFRNETGRTRFAAKVHANWELIRFSLHRLAIVHKAELLRTEVITLADIYHGVGAARAALFLSCLFHFIVNLTMARSTPLPWWRLTCSVLAPYVVAVWLFRVFEKTRTSALKSLLSMLILTFKTFPTNEGG